MDKSLTNFFEISDKMEKSDGCFFTTDFAVQGFCIELSYSRRDFIKDVSNILKTFPQEEHKNLTKPFNFVIESGLLNGCPTINNAANSEINNCVKKFILNNNTSIKGNKELSACLEVITEAFPEFYALIGKPQHHTHDYTVDVHTLKVLQGVMTDKRFKLLSFNDKKVLEIAILLHDLTKREAEIDKTHPECSANEAKEILKRFDISQNLKDRIVLIIRQHDWLERYNKGLTPPEEFARLLKDGNNFLMECILAQADLKAVQRSGFFYEKFKDVLSQGEREISFLINKGLYVA